MTDKLFVTVGAQMAFPRLVDEVDEWIARQSDVEGFAQIGPEVDPPRSMDHVRSLDPDGFAERVAWADVIISHAGMGTIITALVERVPIVVMPRLGDLHETRNDHQVATLDRFECRPGIFAARDQGALVTLLETRAWQHGAAGSAERGGSRQLLDGLAEFVAAAPRRRRFPRLGPVTRGRGSRG